MSKKMQMRKRKVQDEPRYIIGMDAHSKQLSMSIWDWSDRLNPILHREFGCVSIEAMVKTYERHVDLDSITIIEASTNSIHLKKILNEAGFKAEVVRSDTIADKERKRKVCDMQDARNLAHAYIKGDVKEFVWTPSAEYDEYRDITFAYRDAAKELTRISNRIWSLCSRKGYALPPWRSKTKVETLRKMIEEKGLGGFAKEQLENLLDDYERMFNRKQSIQQKMAEIVIRKKTMLFLLQLQGVYYKGAFALDAAVEDVSRFESSAKLAAYGGFSPIVDTSGDEEVKARRNGGTGKPMDGMGRNDIKFFFTEAGHTVLTSCAKSRLGKWGWSMVNRGKHKNKVACAIGRKSLTYGYHILRGDPTPNRDSEEFYKEKLRRLWKDIGVNRMKELGYRKRADFVDSIAEEVYGKLPKKDDSNTAKCA